jgi:hypothetical protein
VIEPGKQAGRTYAPRRRVGWRGRGRADHRSSHRVASIGTMARRT